MYQHSKQFSTAGVPLNEAKKAIIMLHGRGSNADDMLNLANHLQLSDTAILAPQATQQSWYPYSFIAPTADNQPALSSAIALIHDIVQDILAKDIPLNQVYFLGFSQGACLALEYTAQHANLYGGIIAFTGGLIGKELDLTQYQGSFEGSPVLITTGDPDPHVPLYRVNESVKVLADMQASVTLKVYKGRAHTIQKVELELANDLLAGKPLL